MMITLNKKKTAGIVFIVISLALAGIVVFMLQDGENTASDTNKSQQQKKPETADPKAILAAPDMPKEGSVGKIACDYFDSLLAKQTIGSNAKKNDKAVVANQGLNYSSSTCEYTAGGSEATVVIYTHPDKSKVNDTRKELKSKGTSIGDKEGYVASAKVLINKQVDVEKSNKLLEEILGKL